MAGGAETTVPGIRSIVLMVALCTLAFAEWSGPGPIVLASVGRLRRIACTKRSVAAQALFSVATLGLYSFMPSGFAGPSAAERGNSIPIIGTCIRD